VLLITAYLLSAFVNKRWIADAQVALFTLAGLVAIRNSSLRLRTVRFVVAAGFLVSLLMIIIANHHGGNTGRGVAAAWAGLLLLAMVITVVRQILSGPEVTLQSIYGAICAYLVIGLMYSAFYGAMYYLHNRTFFVNGQPGNAANFQYFSFTTLTTLGYGDFTAKLNGGRAVAMLEAMSGQIFLATLVAKLVASFRPAAAAARNSADKPAGGDS
jgi:hypothetical protein